MSEPLEALLTVLANLGGYAVAGLVLIWLFRKGNPTIARIGTAAWALFIFWGLVMGWYAASEWLIAQEGHETVPAWLETTNGIAENNQSEIFQIWLAMLIFKYLREPGSPESK